MVESTNPVESLFEEVECVLTLDYHSYAYNYKCRVQLVANSVEKKNYCVVVQFRTIKEIKNRQIRHAKREPNNNLIIT